MSTGSMRSKLPVSVVSVMLTGLPIYMYAYQFGKRAYELDVEETDVPGVADDEAAARLHVLAHQYREQLVCRRRVVERDEAQDAVRGIHGRLPQLLGVHLAEA